jgi:hypothetical protein
MLSPAALSSCRTASAARCWKIAQAASVGVRGQGSAQMGRLVRAKSRGFEHTRAGLKRGFPTPQ